MKIFSFIITKKQETYYGEFYDFSCFISGTSVNDIVEKANRALKIYISESKFTGNKIIKPAEFEKVKNEHTDSLVVPIAVDETDNFNDYKKEKIIKKNVTIPDWINQLAIKYEIPFSETLKTALLEKLKEKIAPLT